jgi:uncharacterized protein involved in exopolysaccharide biosynthesis
MTKVLEILFRNKWKLVPLLLVPILVSGVVVFLQPRTYVAGASLLALRRYTILGATGPESNLNATPAMTQATALGELLQTRSFDLGVAKDTDLAKHIGIPASNTQAVQDAIYADISAHVSVTATGTNLFVITYTSKSPQLAQQVAQAVTKHYGIESASYATAEGEQLLLIYQGQLKAAQQQVDATTQAAAQYMQQHNLNATSAQADSQYQLLLQQAEQARAALANVQNNINTINQQLVELNSGPEGLYRVVDQPTVPTQPESRSKSLLVGIGVGLLIGLLICLSYFFILVRLDQSVYSADDMPTITDYPVLIQIPRLPRRSAAWIAHPNEHTLPESR